MITKPSREDVLRVVGEPVALLFHDYGRELVCQVSPPPDNAYPVYTEAQLLAMYAAGAEDMRARAGKFCDEQAEKDRQHQDAGNQPADYRIGYMDGSGDCGHGIRALTITNTKGK